MSKHAKSSNGSFHPLSAPDFLPLPQLRDLQLQRLKAIVQRAYDRVALFRKRMDERGLTPQDLRTLDDITQLPFAEKTDLRDTYPFGLFASPMKEIVRLHASSGTTGKPIVVAYTQEDVQVWTNVMLRSFAACGLHEGDVIQNAYGYGLFTGGLGAHYGAEALGATVIPISGGNTPRQLMVMKDFGVTAICCTPSYFLHLIDQAPEVGVNIKELPLRAGIFGAEPWTESMRRRIEADSGIKAYDIYGLSEIVGPGVAMECQCQAGPHIFEDYFYPEIIHLKTGKPCADGEEGELVLTTLGKQAMPMIRYRTRDITALTSETCECGRTLRRIKRIGRRARRHVHHPRHQRLSVADRDRPAQGGRRAAALPDRPDAREGPGRHGGAGGGHAGGLHRHGRRAGATAEQAQQVHRIHRRRARQRAPGPAAHHSAQRRQGQARHRPAENVTPKRTNL